MDGLVGTRSNTMAVMRIHDGEVALLAIPRDLYVTLPSGISGRINASFAIDGPAGLISTIQSNLGIPIDHYLEIDLAGFTGMVDALGGITIDFRYPASDPISGLEVSSSGPTELNGAQALAFVRSRQYTEVIDGQSVTDVTGDLGRVVRQQQFIAAVMADLGSTRNPLTLLQSANALGEYAVIDSSLTLGEVVLLAGPLRGADPVTATLPTTAFTTSEGAQVLSLGADADSVLAFFRGG